ncbi:hypothetical protein LI328DRAFT_61225 [Trichoderma asperelloides]|nr:hypothetical protein LI328DRAFT_61225 [Trichoderma asperelloides]
MRPGLNNVPTAKGKKCVIEEWCRALPPSIGYSVSQPGAEMPSQKQGWASESVSFPAPLYINSSHSSPSLPLRVNENARSIIIKFPVRQSIAQGLYERTKKTKKK